MAETKEAGVPERGTEEKPHDFDLPLRQLVRELQASSIGKAAWYRMEGESEGPCCIVIAVGSEGAKALWNKAGR